MIEFHVEDVFNIQGLSPIVVGNVKRSGDDNHLWSSGQYMETESGKYIRIVSVWSPGKPGQVGKMSIGVNLDFQQAWKLKGTTLKTCYFSNRKED